ncbi:MAG: crossover junction endodeoxyribonuclease RuvC [Gammaproteobacteria bacterium]|nr:crossover junction endodeoxyribonuclease RuvC [Gammaproteobacteria bacterium]
MRIFPRPRLPEPTRRPLRILGIDPGSRITGYGVIEIRGVEHRHLASGRIITGTVERHFRLLHIYRELTALIEKFTPSEAAVESVFMHRNAVSALLLGQARGAALVALAGAGLSLAEYSPAQVKSAVVGYGRAEKAQVQHMVSALLRLTRSPAADAADALAVALCHSRLRSSPLLLLQRAAKSAERSGGVLPGGVSG